MTSYNSGPASDGRGRGESSLRKSSGKSRRASILANSRHRIFQDRLQPPIMWNIQGMRGQMSSNCLWHACKAFFLGVLIFCAGTAMCVMGFYIDGVLGDEFDEVDDGASMVHNGTHRYRTSTPPTPPPRAHLPAHYQTDPSRPQVRFSKLSFIGPIIMGIGGFIIVATCVMTFEARDSAAKVGPSFIMTGSKVANALPVSIPNIMNATMKSGMGTGSGASGAAGAASRSGTGRSVGATPAGPGYRKPRNRNVPTCSVGVQTGNGDDEDGEIVFGSLESGFGDGSHSHRSQGVKFDRRLIIEAFRKFSRTLRTSDSVSSSCEEQIQRYPSAPSLIHTKGSGGHQQAGQPDAACHDQEAEEDSRNVKRSPFMAKSRPRMPPAALRHTMSIDVPPSEPPVKSPVLPSKKGSRAKHHERRKKLQRHVSVPIEQEPVSASVSACKSKSPSPREYYPRGGTPESPPETATPPSTSAWSPPPSSTAVDPVPVSEKVPVSILRNVNASVHFQDQHNGATSSRSASSSSSAIKERHHYLTKAHSMDVSMSPSTRSTCTSVVILEDAKEQDSDSNSNSNSDRLSNH